MLRIFDTSCFFRETMVTRTHFNVTFVSTLTFLFDPYPLFQEHNCGIKQGFGVLWHSIKSND